MSQPSYPPPPPQWGAPPPGWVPPPPAQRKTAKIIALCCGLAALGVLIGGGAAVLAKSDHKAGTAGVAHEPTASASTTEAAVSPECRAWVKKELMDSSSGFNTASGYGVCGDLSEEQLGAVIDDVTEEIADDPKALAEATSTEAEKFQDCVTNTGTATEKEAAKHVTKVTGTEDVNNVIDAAEVFTDYAGGMLGPHQGDGKLIASAFASCYKSDNGLVTVYDEGGDLLANGRY
jgi:hypothetical protein